MDQRSAGRTVAAYSLARVGLFVVCLAVFYLAGMGLLWAMLFAAVVSGAAGWFLLARQREAMSAGVEAQIARARARAAERTAREDAAADQIVAQRQSDDDGAPPLR